MPRLRFLDLLLRNLDDGGAGGAAGAGAGAAAAAGDAAGADPAASVLAAARAAAGQAAAGGQAAAAAPAQPTLEDQANAGAAAGDWKAPDFVPDNLRGKSAEETMQKLTEAWKGYRDKEAKREKLPEAPDGYSYAPSEKVKPFMADNVADDPVLQHVREAALAAEMPPSKFQTFMDSVLGAMVDMGIVDRPVAPDEVLGGMIPDAAASLPREEQLKAAGQRVLGIDAALKAFGADRKFDEGMMREAGFLLGTHEGLRFLEAVLPQPGQKPGGLQPGGQPSLSATITAESLRQRQADPRGQRGTAQFDPAFERETMRQYQQLYGTSPANG
jgi:hypothetical protein